MKTIDQILKIKAVVLYILKAFPEGVDYIHLFKVMYIAQQDQLKEYGLPIIYDTFVARKHGPVPALTYLTSHMKTELGNVQNVRQTKLVRTPR